MAMTWLVSAFVRLNASGFTAGMARVTASTNAANRALQVQQGQITKNQAALQKYAAKLDAARAAQTRLGTTIAGFGAAIGATALIYAISKAADLERAMTGVQIATHASAKEYEQLYRQVIAVSGITAQSAVTIANEMQAAATVAFKDPKQLMALFPMMAKYADVRFMASGGKEDPTESITQMATFAHYFSAYGPKMMQRMLDDTARVQMTTHAQLSQLVTQGKYFIPNAVKLGVSENDIMQYLAIMGQTGFLQGKGGTALNNLILGAEGAVSMNAHLSALKKTSLRDLQMYDSAGRFRFVDEQGHLLLDKMVKHLQAMRSTFERQDARGGNGRWMTDIGGAFGKEAQRFASVIADAVTRAQMDRNAASMARTPGVQGQWEAYNKDFFYQWNAFKTNLENIGTTLAKPVLPMLTAFLGGLNTQLQNLNGFFASHPTVDKSVMFWLTGLTAVFTVRFAAGIVAASRGLLGLSASINALNASLALGGAGAAAGGVGVAAKTGILARAGGFAKWVFGGLDRFFLAGLGGMAIGATSKAFSWSTKAVGWIFDGTANAIRSGVSGYMSRTARFGSSAFRAGVMADMQKGMQEIFDLIFTPLKKAIVAFANFAPRFSSLADVFVGAFGRLLGVFARFLSMVPVLDVAALVLTPTQAGISGEDETRAVGAFNQQRMKHINIHVGNIHVGGDPREAGRKTFEFLAGLANNPQTTLSQGGAFRTGALLPSGATVGGMNYGK